MFYDDISQSCSLNKEGEGHDIHVANLRVKQRRQSGMTQQHIRKSVQAEEHLRPYPPDSKQFRVGRENPWTALWSARNY